MIKKRNKGFMLVELLIVSTFILGTLIFLYIQLVNVNDNYKISFTHNTIPGLYMTKNISRYLVETNYKTGISLDPNKGYKDITNSYYNDTNAIYGKIISNSNIAKIIITKENPITLQNYLKNNPTDSFFDKKFQAYIFKISNSANNNLDRYRLIIKFNNNTYASVVLP